MDEQSIRQIVAQVLAGQLAGGAQPVGASGGEIPLEVSARHVHLTTQAVEQLFGKGAKLTAKRALSQPGEFLSEQRVKLVTPKGEIMNVAVLGPERSKIQVELSLTDARQLGITVPVNLSGDLTGAGSLFLVGDAGMMEAPGSAIAARCHIHMTPEDAQAHGVQDGQQVAVEVESPRPMTFRCVTVRVSPHFALAMHIDFDEANACGASCGAKGRILTGGATPLPAAPAAVCPVAACPPQVGESKAKVVTEAIALELAASGSQTVFLPKGTLITPSAQDIFIHRHISVQRR